MLDVEEEVRQRRADTKARQAAGEAMADGRTERQLDGLLARIDQLREKADAHI